MPAREIDPIEVRGRPLAIGGWTPKWDITCGECGRGFKERLSVGETEQRHACPWCGAVNVWETQWERAKP